MTTLLDDQADVSTRKPAMNANWLKIFALAPIDRPSSLPYLCRLDKKDDKANNAASHGKRHYYGVIK